MTTPNMLLSKCQQATLFDYQLVLLNPEFRVYTLSDFPKRKPLPVSRERSRITKTNKMILLTKISNDMMIGDENPLSSIVDLQV